MVRNFLRAGVVGVFFATAVTAGSQNLDQSKCKQNLEASISALKLMESQTGKPQTFNGLTEKQIREIESKEGACAAAQKVMAVATDKK